MFKIYGIFSTVKINSSLLIDIYYSGDKAINEETWVLLSSQNVLYIR
ncbi:MAG: hypothetical protein ACE5IH_10235 [Thermodesulfobacteriota bacterium]